MEVPTTLELDLTGHRLEFQVQRVTDITSPHTGRPLVQLHGQAAVRDEDEHRELCKRLEASMGRRVRSVEPYDDRVRTWRMSWNAYLESEGVHWYTLILQEEEELLLEELVLGDDVRLHPYEYREVFSGPELTIWAKLVGSRAEILRLRALLKHHPRFPVVRRGISDEPRLMRFGVAEWSEHDTRIKVRVVLVDDDTDLTEHPALVQVEEENTRSALAFYMNYVEELTKLLEAKGLVSARELEAARSAARDTPWRSRHEFWRVPDVDLL